VINPTYLGLNRRTIMELGSLSAASSRTSLVSVATFKVDGLSSFLESFGIFLFGETVQYFEGFWESSNYGRLTLMDWLGLTTGQVVLIIVLMALLMFAFAELMESFIGKRDLKAEPKIRIAGAALLIAGAVAVLIIGQPTLSEKWAKISSVKEASLAAREVQISPAELLSTKANDGLRLVMLDIRPESEYNLFHIDGAKNVQLEELENVAADIISQSAPNLVVAVMSNDEDAATEAWKTLAAASVPNVYILEGGINNWITTFGKEEPDITPITSEQFENDTLRYLFEAALGGRYECSDPNPHEFDFEFEPKIKLELKRDKSGGGCG
jgi:rhodanese-related sulfurtransferase